MSKWTTRSKFMSFMNKASKIEPDISSLIPVWLKEWGTGHKWVDVYVPSEICAHKPISKKKYKEFIAKLYLLNTRDALIAEVLFGGMRRITEVLNLKIDDIDVDNSTILFKEKVIEYCPFLVARIECYIKDSSERRNGSQFVFVTRTGSRLTRSRIAYSFARCTPKSCEKICPEVLRSTYSHLLRSGIL